MAYKQPYKQVSKNNDGASEPITALLAIGGKLAAKAAAKVAAKAAGKALAKKGVQTIGKKAMQEGSKRLVQEGGKKIAGQMIKKGAVNAAQSAMPTLQTNVTSSVAKSATKKGLGKAVAKAGEIGKSVISKGKEVVQKGKDIYDKGAKKVADATGFDVDEVKETAETLATNAKAKIGEKIAESRSGEESEDMSPAERKLPSGLVPDTGNNSNAYTNPTGISMFDHRKQYGPSMKSKYDNANYGASQDEESLKLNSAGGKDQLKKEDDKPTIGSSLDENNVFESGFGDTSLGNFSAPITIKGVTFDAGDAVRLGIMGFKAGKKAIKDRKAITADEGFKETKKQLKSTKYEKGQYKPKFKANKDAIKDKLKSIKKEIKTKK